MRGLPWDKRSSARREADAVLEAYNAKKEKECMLEQIGRLEALLERSLSEQVFRSYSEQVADKEADLHDDLEWLRTAMSERPMVYEKESDNPLEAIVAIVVDHTWDEN